MNEQEYMERVAGLFDKIKAEAATEDEVVLLERYRDAEFDLLVEFRLGADFPTNRLEALRAIHRLSLRGAEASKAQFLSGELTREQFVEKMQAATRKMVDAYKSVLTSDEVTALLGSDEGGPELALEMDAL